MKVIPMHQPWAQLVVLGAKKVETRPKPTPKSLKGLVAIHANKTTEHLELQEEAYFWDHLRGLELPLGCIVGTAEIVRSVTITEQVAAWQRENNPEEYAFGDYTPGRFGWVLRNAAQLVKPIPFRAHQGWPDIEDSIVREVML